jgi:predicted enzyme related to lactoylglutathione lyase
MTSRVVHFTIPIDNPDRAAAFYQETFGWNVSKWGPIEYRTMTTGAEPAPERAHPASRGTRRVVVDIGVDEIDRAMAKVKDAGGTLVTEKLPIPAMGWSARLRFRMGAAQGSHLFFGRHVERAIVRRANLHPLAEVPQEDAPPSRGASRCRYEVPALEQLIAAQLDQVVLNISQSQIRTGYH